MLDVIQLLPDSLANKIAAGEVVQRPASAVKELLENAVDAKSTRIKLILKDGGATLIQVMDNGVGMSLTDARMCWERHATSKIKKVDDLFNIRSFGFRGEALASIAAVAQVEMRTKRAEDELGSIIKIEGSKVIKQEPVECTKGTQISVKNLFYNLPARRSFLKSNSVETRHSIDQFIRVAMAQPGIEFILVSNDREMFRLLPSQPKERFEALMGYKSNVRLLPVFEETSFVNIEGWISEPSQAKKSRGEQFFFVNNRYVKDNYLNHAVFSAYDGLIEKYKFPSFMLNLELDPKHIDINVHPTKTEVKFVDERGLYAMLKSVVRKALSGLLAEISPTEEFANLSSGIREERVPSAPNSKGQKMKSNYNPFGSQERYSPKIHPDWQKFYELENQEDTIPQKELVFKSSSSKDIDIQASFCISKTHIATKIDGIFYLLDISRAHLRVLYERFLKALRNSPIASQQVLFPRTIMLSAPDFELFLELQEDVQKLGCDMHAYGKNQVIVNGLPPNVVNGDEKDLLEGILEDYKNSNQAMKLNHVEKLALSLAQNTKSVVHLEEEENRVTFLKELWNTEIPFSTPQNLPIVKRLGPEELKEIFKK